MAWRRAYPFACIARGQGLQKLDIHRVLANFTRAFCDADAGRDVVRMNSSFPVAFFVKVGQYRRPQTQGPVYALLRKCQESAAEFNSLNRLHTTWNYRHMVRSILYRPAGGTWCRLVATGCLGIHRRFIRRAAARRIGNREYRQDGNPADSRRDIVGDGTGAWIYFHCGTLFRRDRCGYQSNQPERGQQKHAVRPPFGRPLERGVRLPAMSTKSPTFDECIEMRRRPDSLTCEKGYHWSQARLRHIASSKWGVRRYVSIERLKK